MPTSGQTRKRTAALFVGLLLSLVYTSAAMQPPVQLDSSEDCIASHELQRQLDALQIKHDTVQHNLQHKYDALLHELPRWMKRKIRSKEETTEVAYQVCSASAASCEDWPQPSPNRLGEDDAVDSGTTLTLGSDHKFDWSDHSTADKEYWTQCESEGGDVNCAQCDTSGGGLACSAIPPLVNNVNPEDCPDSLGALKFWNPSGTTGLGTCKSFNSVLNLVPLVFTYTGSDKGIESDGSVTLLTNANDFLPGVDGTFLGPHIVTKATTAHPHKAAINIGAILFKRAVMHPHTNKTYVDASGEERPLMVGDVAKVGYCIQCPSDVFSKTKADKNTKADHQKFYDDCLVDTLEEVTVDGTAVWQIKADYTCDVDSRDYRYFQALLSGY